MSALLLSVAIAGIVLGALASGVVGLGFPIVAVPALALGYGLEVAVVVSALPTFAIDLVNLHRTRAERSRSAGLLLFGICAAVVTVLGTLVRDSLDERVLVAILTGTIALYLGAEFLPKIDLRALARKPGTGAAAGSAAGLLQATVGVSGPIVGMYYLNRTDNRMSFIFHVTAVFAVMGFLRISTLFSVGAYTAERVIASVVIAIFAVALRTIGFWIGNRVDREHFRKAVMVVLACSLVPLLLQTF